MTPYQMNDVHIEYLQQVLQVYTDDRLFSRPYILCFFQSTLISPLGQAHS